MLCVVQVLCYILCRERERVISRACRRLLPSYFRCHELSHDGCSIITITNTQRPLEATNRSVQVSVLPYHVHPPMKLARRSIGL
jgi:hypothetical protein